MLIPKNLFISKGTFTEYKKLERYHYSKQEPGPFTHIFCIRPRIKNYKTLPPIIGVHTIGMPLPDLRPRTKATNEFFKKPKSKSERLKLVNKKIRYASRIIINPLFHNLGLAKWLISETLPMVGFPIIETLTHIDYTNVLCVKAGYKVFNTPSPAYYTKLCNAIRKTGLTVDFRLLPETFHKRLEMLSPETRLELEQEIHQFLSRFHGRYDMPPNLERSRFILSKIPYPCCYLIWFNPEMDFRR